MAKDYHDYDWHFICRFSQCHNWFVGTDRDGRRRVAVGDDSGSLPELCDDGVVWLDTEKTITIEANSEYLNTMSPQSRYEYLRKRKAIVHGIDNKGDQVIIGGTNGYEAIEVARRFEVPYKFTADIKAEQEC